MGEDSQMARKSLKRWSGRPDSNGDDTLKLALAHRCEHRDLRRKSGFECRHSSSSNGSIGCRPRACGVCRAMPLRRSAPTTSGWHPAGMPARSALRRCIFPGIVEPQSQAVLPGSRAGRREHNSRIRCIGHSPPPATTSSCCSSSPLQRSGRAGIAHSILKRF